MNLQKLKKMAFAGRQTLNNNNPFIAGQAGENIFKAVEGRRTAESAESAHYERSTVPSQAVPGVMVPGVQQGRDQISTAVERAGGSPLDKYMSSAHNMPKQERTNSQPSAGQEQQQQQQQQSSTTQQPKSVFDTNYEDYVKSIEQANFVSSADSELAKKALSGDPESLTQLLNQVSRRSVASSAFMATQVAKTGLDQWGNNFRSEVPGVVRSAEFESLDFSDIPEASSPMVGPLLQPLVKQFREAYPNASPSQIKSGVQGYLKDLIGSKKAEEQESEQRPDMRNLFKFS